MSNSAIISTSDVEAIEQQPQGPFDHVGALHNAHNDDRVVYTEGPTRGGRRKDTRPPKSGNNYNRQRGGDHWTEIQELKSKLEEHEAVISKFKSAFAMMSAIPDLGTRDASPRWLGVEWQGVDAPANRPQRTNGRRGGSNGVNVVHYKNNNRGGGFNPGGVNPVQGGYRGGRGNSAGFRASL